jgi:hypothetical protein
MLPFPPNNLPFLNYIQDLARANNITSPILMGQFLENLQRDLFSSAIESRRISPLPLPPFVSQTVQQHHHHHPYYSQILLNNSFLNHFSSSPTLNRFHHPISDNLKDHPTFPFHFSAPKKRRTKVNKYIYILFLIFIELFNLRLLIHVYHHVLHQKFLRMI